MDQMFKKKKILIIQPSFGNEGIFCHKNCSEMQLSSTQV